MNLLDYAGMGFLPLEKEQNENMFRTRTERIIDNSRELKRMVKEKDSLLEQLFKGDLSKLYFNPYHEEACSELYKMIGVGPNTFVGFYNNLSDVSTMHSNMANISNFVGLCESISLNGFNFPVYAVKMGRFDVLETTEHELYHCISRIPVSYKPNNEIKPTKLEEKVFNGFRASCFNIHDAKIEKDMRSMDKHAENIVNPARFRQLLYQEMDSLPEIYFKKRKDNSDWFMASIFAAYGVAIGFLEIPIIPKAIACGVSGGHMGVHLFNAFYRLHNNLSVDSAFEKIKDFMSFGRELIKEEFSLRGSNYLAYNFTYKETKKYFNVLKKGMSLKDSMHNKNTLRSKVMLDYALSLD